MSDINTQQFTTRNSVSLITLPGTHRSGNIAGQIHRSAYWEQACLVQL